MSIEVDKPTQFTYLEEGSTEVRGDLHDPQNAQPAGRESSVDKLMQQFRNATSGKQVRNMGTSIARSAPKD